jgi:uncharacterized membrane protein
MVGGAVVRHLMNIRFTFAAWRPVLAVTAVATVAGAFVLSHRPAGSGQSDAELAATPAVPFETVQAIISLRCVSCHSATPSDALFPSAPAGVKFDRPAEIRATSTRIRIRVEGETMPFANRTNMTEDERMTVVRWVAQGARIE